VSQIICTHLPDRYWPLALLARGWKESECFTTPRCLELLVSKGGDGPCGHRFPFPDISSAQTFPIYKMASLCRRPLTQSLDVTAAAVGARVRKLYDFTVTSRKCVVLVVCVKLGKWYVVKHSCVTWGVFNDYIMNNYMFRPVLIILRLS